MTSVTPHTVSTLGQPRWQRTPGSLMCISKCLAIGRPALCSNPPATAGKTIKTVGSSIVGEPILLVLDESSEPKKSYYVFLFLFLFFLPTSRETFDVHALTFLWQHSLKTCNQSPYQLGISNPSIIKCKDAR